MMQKFLVFSLWITIVTARSGGTRFTITGENQTHLGRIVGGVDAQIEDFPYQLSVRIRGNHNCGASVISENWALSAAHCTYPKLETEAYTLWGESSHRLKGGTIFEVDTVENHPSYDERTIRFDVCVLKTKDAMIGSIIQPVQLASINEDSAPGTPAIVSGWGLTSVPGILATILQMINVPLVSQDVCRSYWGDMVTSDMLCAKELNLSICSSDSGGPLFAEGRQVGIVSWGEGTCQGRMPGVYARVAHPDIRVWITGVTGI